MNIIFNYTNLYSKLMIIVLLLIISTMPCFATIKGIYLTQSTLSSPKKMNYFIKQAKKHNINTFVIDIWAKSKRYKKNIKNVMKHNIHVVSRIVIFPKGATSAQANSQRIINKRLALAKYVLNMGVKEIQLDYIRYKPQQPRSYQNTRRIHQVIKQFRKLTDKYGAKLQIDIFGVVAHRPNHNIGQDVGLFANTVDTFCPMVYPSHYEPYRIHAKTPYKTIYNSLSSMKKQLKKANKTNRKVVAYIEVYNYRYPMSFTQKVRYIREQIRATKAAGIAGWYAWSPRNQYQALFRALSK